VNTTTSRGLIALVATPIAAASILAGALATSSAANAASVVPGVNTHTSGMELSKEYIAQQKDEHGAAVKPIDLQRQQEAAQTDSPAKQEASELKGDIKAEEVKEVALNTVESLANVQTPEPKAHVYKLKNPIHKHLAMIKAGFSQVAR
jgi:hypothetical protein